ncbi:hypothetical protein RHAL1_01739 [Beijerinckiaceae bacterium RH AL1]|jgi:hypothetical protein|nr:hypothetical protein [Beijerinckiaceae bacterium]VVB45383.1 hypothetical protein RHCH11_RHCH11_01701 [Beijerinckiaceae bacterium RH CH11]VVB45460.1 hypothetical protein RHAL8_01697 [Beijerinckiaceae bacterium RH AL8]VVC54838.1 hypothetical protein RHAL1_01739 [Beijerinckiaceae bacterium RH AL1]
MRFCSMIAAATLGLGLAGTAQAAPTASLQSAVDVGPAPQIELVRGGCGFGEHRTYSGYCRYNHGWRGRVRYRHNHWY